jgi:DNA-binding NtrC family response regulator
MTTTQPKLNVPTAERPGRILIVDDDAAMRMSLSGLLSDDFEVTATGDTAQAEAALRANEFDVVLSDYDMPGETGMEFFRRIHSSYPGVMGILLTGHGEHPDVRRAEADQTVVRVISKPYDPARLLKWVENTVRLARMRQAMNQIARPPRSLSR